MIGVPEEMMTVVEGEAWMMGHVMARTPNHGSPSVDLVRLHHQINSFAFNSSVGGEKDMHSYQCITYIVILHYIHCKKECVYRHVVAFTYTVEIIKIHSD